MLSVRRETQRAGLFFLALALAAGVAAAFAAWQALREAAPTVGRVVLARDMPPYHALTAEDVRLEFAPAAAVPGDALRQPDQAVGRFLVGGMLSGDTLRQRHLSAAAAEGGPLAAKLAAKGRQDLRAFPLPGSVAPGLVRQLAPGDRLDLVRYVAVEGGRGMRHQAKVMAAGVPILELVPPPGKRMDEDPEKATVIVALTPVEVEELSYAMAQGRVYLALAPRNAEPIATRGYDGPPAQPEGGPKR